MSKLKTYQAIDDPDLSQSELRELYNYDPLTGQFKRRTTRAGVSINQKVGTVSGGYLRVSVNGKRHMAHRLAWLYMTGEWPKHTIDHINRNRLDNRWHNLRCLPFSENGQNQCGKGYSLNKKLGKYVAQIGVGGRQNRKTIYLGLFDDPKQARVAYLAAKAKHHPNYTGESQ